jgi:hypothetical protein
MSTYSEPTDIAANSGAASAWANTYVRDNMRFLARDDSNSRDDCAPMGFLMSNVDQTAVANDDQIYMTQPIDEWGEMISSPSGGHYWLQAPIYGYYEFTAMCRLACTYDGSGNGEVGLKIYQPDSGIILGLESVSLEANRTVRIHVHSVPYVLAPGQQVELRLFSQNMSNVDVKYSDRYSPTLWGRWVARYGF